MGESLKKKIIGIILCAQLLLVHTTFVRADQVEEQSWDNEIIYSLMIDRFSDGDSANNIDINKRDPLSFNGGDFRGIIDRLDYLQKMNFTVVQLSSIFANREGGFHGEWVEDYFQPDPHFGTVDELNELVEEAHKRNMKIIIEFPIMSKEEYPDLENAVLNSAKWWKENTSIDGFKMMNVSELSLEFWKLFNKELNAKEEAFYISAADQNLAADELSLYADAGFDALVNVPLNEPLRYAFAKLDRSLGDLMSLEQQENSYPIKLESFLDNQYLKRYTREMIEQETYPVSAWKRVLTYLYTQPNIPIIYYGSETGEDGSSAPDNTPLMSFQANQEMLDFISKLGEIRQNEKALTKGTLELLYEKDGMIVFKREYESDTVLVAINNTTKDQMVRIPKNKLANEKELRGMLEDNIIRSSDEEYSIFVERERTEIFKVVDETGYNLFFIFSILIVFILFGVFLYVAWKRGKNRIPE